MSVKEFQEFMKTSGENDHPLETLEALLEVMAANFDVLAILIAYRYNHTNMPLYRFVYHTAKNARITRSLFTSCINLLTTSRYHDAFAWLETAC